MSIYKRSINDYKLELNHNVVIIVNFVVVFLVYKYQLPSNKIKYRIYNILKYFYASLQLQGKHTLSYSSKFEQFTHLLFYYYLAVNLCRSIYTRN